MYSEGLCCMGEEDGCFPVGRVGLGRLTEVLGCLNCEFRSGVECPFFDGVGSVLPVEGICGKRRDWVLSLLPRYKVEPSADQVMLDVSKALQGFRERAEYFMIAELEGRLRVAEAGGDLVEVERLEERLRERKKQFLAVSGLVAALRDRQVDRECPKRVEVKQEVRLTPELFGEALKRVNRGKVIDVGGG